MRQEVDLDHPLPKSRESQTNYLNAKCDLKSWLLTRDHKRIALLYLVSISCFFLLGGVYALSIRLELLTPQGDVFQSDTYNKLFTQHGIIMVFFFLIPSIPTTLGNYLLPLMVGAKDLAFPRLNLLSWYIFNLGGVLTIYALLGGGVDTGWTFHVRTLLMISVPSSPMLFFIMVMNKHCALGVENREVELTWERCRSREAKEVFDNV